MELTTCQSVLEDWISTRKISSKKLSFLELIHKKNVHNLQNSKVGINEICPAHICDELDIPRGNNMIYALAQFLVQKRWNKTLVLTGSLNQDILLSKSFKESSKKFGIKIVKEKTSC